MEAAPRSGYEGGCQVNLHRRSAVQRFLSRHADKIIGVLSGFDRVVFRGSLRQLSHAEGMRAFLNTRGVLLKDFGAFVESTTARIKAASLAMAVAANRPIEYLSSPAISKEDYARAILRTSPVENGLICILKSVEPCMTFEIHRSRERKQLELVKKHGKCLFFYHYMLDPELGFLHARVQTWFPFAVQVCLNGREWLARQMDRQAISYERRDNCFARIDDLSNAQRLMDEQVNVGWPNVLGRLALAINPALPEVLAECDVPYYWSVHQSEWATDVMFYRPSSLAAIYQALVHHGITHFQSADVMRFLGRRVLPGFQGEITSDFKDRFEGVRIKHAVERNSIKLYDKQGSVLRVETTINDPSDFKVFRPAEGGPQEELRWRPMRKGVADLFRRTQVSQAANARYLEAMAEVDTSEPIGELVRTVCKPTLLDGKRVRALKLWNEDDLALFAAVTRGEYVVNGFRNRDIVAQLYPRPFASTIERRRASARVTRLFRLLRAHHLIAKVQGTHRYHVTSRGRSIIAAIVAARTLTTRQLNAAAA